MTDHRVFKITDESNNRHGPCYVVRERKRAHGGGYVWEWTAWCRTLAEADSHARGLGELTREGVTLADWRE